MILVTSGSTRAVTDALDSLARWGRGCFVDVGAEVRLGVLPHLRRPLTFMTSWSTSWRARKEWADFVVRHQLLNELFSHRWSLDEVETSVEFDKQRAGKGVILF